MEIKILYIDDEIDTMLSEYLEEEYEINYDEYQFKIEDSYEMLLNNTKIQDANIIIIDSQLFENNKVNQKFTGDEVKIILRKEFPYKEVIVITQNAITNENNYVVEKYKKNSDNDAKEYYNQKLKPKIEIAKEQIQTYEKLSKKLNKNESVDKVLREKISNSLEGINKYQELKKEDIDKLINAFKEFKERNNE